MRESVSTSSNHLHKLSLIAIGIEVLGAEFLTTTDPSLLFGFWFLLLPLQRTRYFNLKGIVEASLSLFLKSGSHFEWKVTKPILIFQGGVRPCNDEWIWRQFICKSCLGENGSSSLPFPHWTWGRSIGKAFIIVWLGSCPLWPTYCIYQNHLLKACRCQTEREGHFLQ